MDLEKVNAWLQRKLGRSEIWIGDLRYMTRWRFFESKYINFRLHHIEQSDIERELHDHPFTFVSFVLRGGYFETRYDSPVGRSKVMRWHGPGSVLFRSAETLHRLTLPKGETAWTFVVTGPRRRLWGYQTDRGWVDWVTYSKQQREAEKAEVGNGVKSPFMATSSI